jgi:hypothetical protein
MANVEKHKRDLIDEWQEGEGEAAPAQSGKLHVVASGGKAVPRRLKLPVQDRPGVKPDPALIREAAPPPKPDEKHSQASAPDHLRRLQRIPKLRAPYAPKSNRPGVRG